MKPASLTSVAADDAVALDVNAPTESSQLAAGDSPDSGRDNDVAASNNRNMLFAVAAVLAVAWFPYLVSSIHYWAYPDDTNLSFLAQSLLDVPNHIAVVVVVLYVMYRDGRPWSAFGITRPRWIRDPLEAFAVVITAYFVLDRLYGFSGMVVGADAVAQFSESTDAFATPSTSVEIIILLLLSLSIGLSEEISMRGYLLPTFEQLLNSTALSVLLTSMLFASCHTYQGFGASVWIFVGGMVFGIIFAVWRRLWPLVLAHAAMDVVAMWPSW